VRGVRSVLPLADAPAFASAARRTAALRYTVAAALVALVVLAFLAARRPDRAVPPAVAAGSALVVVLDVSASVSGDADARVVETLESVSDAARTQGVGLVLFADIAVEALPPGTSAAELRHYVRYFRRPEERTFSYVDKPWQPGIGGGTSISAGLGVARSVLGRDAGGRGIVLLVSDLAAPERDVDDVRRELAAYRRDAALDLRIVAVPPATPQNRAFFRRYVDADSFVVHPASLRADAPELTPERDPFPARLVLFVVLAGLAVAIVELVAVPFVWRERAGGSKA
jgi:hypothetical protein